MTKREALFPIWKMKKLITSLSWFMGVVIKELKDLIYGQR